MAILFIDGFDHYAIAERLRKWTGNRSNAVSAMSSTTRFSSGQSLDVNSQASGQGIFKTLEYQATWTVGFAIMFDDDSAVTFFYLTQDGLVHVQLTKTGSNQLQLQNGNGTTIATGTTIIAEDTWYYLELQVTIGNSAAYEFRINEVSEFSGTGDTQNGGSAVANRIEFQSNANNGFQLDDLYALDGTGGAPYDDFLGDVRVETLFPSGNGNSSQFDGSDGNTTDNYLLVDEQTDQDDDTTYVQSPDVGDKDTYAYGNLVTVTGDVLAVQLAPVGRKTSAGGRSFNHVARLSATEEDGAAVALQDSFLVHRDIRTTKPGGGAWSVSDVNSAEFGYKIAS